MKSRNRVSVLLTAAALAAACVPAAGQSIHLEFVGVPGRADMPVPPVCTTWHEIYPNHCTPHHQTGYGDDGDGFVSVCDQIQLDGLSYHIDWVGPTYYLVGIPGRDVVMYLEPQEIPGRNPVCETWHEIYPDYCIAHHIDAWEDNGDGIVSPCDMVWLNDVPWHIESIGFNIIVTPDSPVEPDSWSRIKQMFRTLFGS